MSAEGEGVAATRQALEATFGLALETVSDGQIATAIRSAGAAPLGSSDTRWLERLVDHLPIDESWLFRDDDLWTWLRDEEGPALLNRAMALSRPVRILSLACSAGQEAFSLAILFEGLLERAGIPCSAARSYVSIVGVDASPARVEVARAGAVSSWSVQRCRADWLRGRVTLEDALSARYRVHPAVRAMCRFEVGNLVALATAGNAALGGFDLVLCRNALIYFRAAAAEQLTALLAQALDPGAFLVVSAAEAHLLGRAGLEQFGPLGAGRAGRPVPPAPRKARPPARRRLLAPAHRTPRRKALASAGTVSCVAAAAGAKAAPAASDAGDAHLRVAFEHARAGRGDEALREARAALFHDPRHLVSRMLVGQQLMEADADRGREVLRELLRTISGLRPDAEVPRADGLTVGQLTVAVQLLLSSEPG